MLEIFGLEESHKFLSRAHVELDKVYLLKILQKASGDIRPHRNKIFTDEIGGSSLMRKERVPALFIVGLSTIKLSPWLTYLR